MSAFSNSSNITTSPSVASITPPATLPSGGSGTSYALACQGAWQSWFSADASFSSYNAPLVTTITETPMTIAVTPTKQPYFLCDGIPRYNEAKPYSTYNLSTSAVRTVHPRNPIPAPSCSIQPTDCNAVHSFYNSILKTANGSYTYHAICTPIVTQTTRFCGNCTFIPSHVKLLYWPVTTTNGDLCLGNGSTITQMPTGNGPNTVVTNGTTFTSPTVYMLYDTLAAKNFCGRVGNSHTDGIIALNPTDVSSMPASGIPGGGLKPTQVNYADLPPNPVPWNVYSAQVLPEKPYTFTDFGNQSTIWNDYAPFLSIPVPQARAIDPAWSSCYFYPQFDALFDPPHALVSATTMLTPTSAADPPVPAPPPAQPVSNGVLEMPSKTATQLDPVQTPVDPQHPSPQVSVDPQPAPVLPAATPQSYSPHEPNEYHNSASPVSRGPQLTGHSNVDPQPEPSPPAANPQPSVPEQSDDPQHPASVASPGSLPNAQSGGESLSPQAVASKLNPVQLQPTAGQGAAQSRISEGNSPIQGSFNPSVVANAQSTAYSGAVVTIGSQVVTAVVSRPMVVDGSTLSINAPAATISGEIISLGPSAVVVGDSVVPYSNLFPPAAGSPSPVPTQQPPTPHAILTLGSRILTALQDSRSSSQILVGSAALVVGGPAVTINGQLVSAKPSGVVLNGVSTITFSEPIFATSTAGVLGGPISSSRAPTAGAPTPVSTRPLTMNAVLTLGSQTLTAMYDLRSSNLIVVGSATLSAGGPATTVNGQIVSAEPSGIVLNGVSTITLSDASFATSTSGGIGGIIISMLGPYNSPSDTATAGNSTAAPNQSIEPFRSAAPGRGAKTVVTLLVAALIIALM